jgi:uncharacterized membrane protein YjjB (DUF3815 family)
MKYVYLIALFIFIILTGVMFQHHWKPLGIFMAILAVASLVNYVDIIQNNKKQ